jgi:hypothetical protein
LRERFLIAGGGDSQHDSTAARRFAQGSVMFRADLFRPLPDARQWLIRARRELGHYRAIISYLAPGTWSDDLVSFAPELTTALNSNGGYRHLDGQCHWLYAYRPWRT